MSKPRALPYAPSSVSGCPWTQSRLLLKRIHPLLWSHPLPGSTLLQPQGPTLTPLCALGPSNPCRQLISLPGYLWTAPAHVPSCPFMATIPLYPPNCVGDCPPASNASPLLSQSDSWYPSRPALGRSSAFPGPSALTWLRSGPALLVMVPPSLSSPSLWSFPNWRPHKPSSPHGFLCICPQQSCRLSIPLDRPLQRGGEPAVPSTQLTQLTSVAKSEAVFPV